MTDSLSPARLTFMVLYRWVWPALVLFLAGNWLWIAGWLFDLWFVSLCATTIAWLFLKDPALLLERFRRPGTGGQKPVDVAIVYMLAIGFLVWIALMPLDAKRLHWTPAMPLQVRIGGAIVLVIAWVFMFRSFVDNPGSRVMGHMSPPDVPSRLTIGDER